MEIADIYTDIDLDLKKDIRVNAILEKLDALLSTIPELDQKRTDNRIIELCCNYIENYCNNKKYKLDKKKIVMDFLKKKFSLHEPEMKSLDMTIEYMIRHGIIKKLSTSKTIKKFVLGVIKKRLF